MYVLLIAAAVVWGAASGFLIPRAAYRLAVEPEEPWRRACPGGHPLTGVLGGWLGRARCVSADADAAAAVSASADDGPQQPPTSPASEAQAAPAAPAPVTAAVRCAGGRSYGPRTPVVVVVTALVCAALAAAAGPRPELVVWLLTAPVAVLLALVDYQVHRLPDVLTLPLAAATALLLGAVALFPNDAGSWPTALLGALALGASYFVLFLVNPNGMGFGDVKLSLALGAALGWYGWTVLLTGAFMGLLLGAFYGLGLMVLRRAGRKSAIPLGPFIIGGTFVGLVLGGMGAS